MKYVLTVLCGVVLTLGFNGDVQAQVNNDIDNFTRVFDGGIGDAIPVPPNPNDVTNMVRSWELEAGHDIDNDGLKEFSAYDADNKVYFIWENTDTEGSGWDTLKSYPYLWPKYIG